MNPDHLTRAPAQALLEIVMRRYIRNLADVYEFVPREVRDGELEVLVELYGDAA